jgi:NADPH-dependent ferric siderophore reductase
VSKVVLNESDTLKMSTRVRFVEVRVAAQRAITPRLWEILLRGPALRIMNAKPGAHLPVEVPLERGGAVLRTYSVWAHDWVTSSLTLRVVDHRPGGPGSRWAASASVGQRLRIGLPRNRISLEPSAPYHVFVGEETGAVPLLNILAAVPGATKTFGVLETVDRTTELSVPDGAGIDWVHRGAASPVNSRLLVRAVRQLDLPERPGVAYVAGESATCRAVARHLVAERGWTRRAVRTQVHWTPGHAGLL